MAHAHYDPSAGSKLTVAQSLKARDLFFSYKWKPVAPDLAPVLGKWKQFRPRQLRDVTAITQAQLERELKIRWAQRTLQHFLPYKASIRNLQVLQDSHDFYREALDLFGDLTFATWRFRCLQLEALLKMDLSTGEDSLSWKPTGDAREEKSFSPSRGTKRRYAQSSTNWKMMRSHPISWSATGMPFASTPNCLASLTLKNVPDWSRKRMQSWRDSSQLSQLLKRRLSFQTWIASFQLKRPYSQAVIPKVNLTLWFSRACWFCSVSW